MGVQYLEQNRVMHIDIIESIGCGSGMILAADTAGVLVFDRKANLYLMSAQTPAAVRQMADLIDDAVLVAVHQEFAADIISNKFGLRKTMCCYQAMWEHLKAPVVSADVVHEYRRLSFEMEEEICSLYSHETDRAYIHGRLAAQEMFGAFIGGELAGFIGLHEEGSMGMLEVKPKFRRLGIGAKLISKLCEFQLARGRTPFSQFVLENEESRRLHERLGFVISKEHIFWLEK